MNKNIIKSDSKDIHDLTEQFKWMFYFKTISNNKCFCAPNQHIIIISEGLCDIEYIQFVLYF